jgi:hypothetical protein
VYRISQITQTDRKKDQRIPKGFLTLTANTPTIQQHKSDLPRNSGKSLVFRGDDGI